jgi:hypothetical protein
VLCGNYYIIRICDNQEKISIFIRKCANICEISLKIRSFPHFSTGLQPFRAGVQKYFTEIPIFPLAFSGGM